MNTNRLKLPSCTVKHLFCQTPVLGLGLGVNFTFAWDNKNNNNYKNPHLNFDLSGVWHWRPSLVKDQQAVAKVVLSSGLGILSTFAVGWGGESRLYLISVRLEFKVVAKLAN